jgi:hypothetical protein
MIKLKDILKEASGNQMTFGEYGYNVKQVESEIKKVLGSLIKSIEPFSNDKDEIGHIKFNFKDKDSMKKFLSKDEYYVDSIEKLLSRKFGVDVMITSMYKGDLMLSFFIFSEMKDVKKQKKSMDAMIKQKTLKVLDSVVDNVKPYSKDAAFHIEQAISIIEKFKGQ